MTSYTVRKIGEFEVRSTPDLDGGGGDFGQAFTPFIQARIGPVEHLLEWGCGAGFIGFALLSAGLCRTLDLSDINPLAQDAVACTVHHCDALKSRVRFHLADCFDGIPRLPSWDLIIGNPPHANVPEPMNEYERNHPSLIWQDADWELHRRFYGSVSAYLKPGGSVILQENYRFSEPADFEPFLEGSSLELVGAYPCGTGYEDYYFLWSRLIGTISPGGGSVQ